MMLLPAPLGTTTGGLTGLVELPANALVAITYFDGDYRLHTGK